MGVIVAVIDNFQWMMQIFIILSGLVLCATIFAMVVGASRNERRRQ